MFKISFIIINLVIFPISALLMILLSCRHQQCIPIKIISKIPQQLQHHTIKLCSSIAFSLTHLHFIQPPPKTFPGNYLIQLYQQLTILKQVQDRFFIQLLKPILPTKKSELHCRSPCLIKSFLILYHLNELIIPANCYKKKYFLTNFWRNL